MEYLMHYDANELDITTSILNNPDNPEQKRLFEAAYALYDQLFIEEEKDGKEALLAGISAGAGRTAPWVVAIDQKTGQVVGGTVVTVFNDRPASTFGYHFTDTRFRRRGIGRKLRQAALEYIKSFNEQKDIPAQTYQIKIFADIENPAKMSFRDILATTATANIDPWGRARFWERQGLLPIVCAQTGEAFPFVVIPDAQNAEPTEALDLWVAQPWAEVLPGSLTLDAREVTQDVVFWLFGAPDLRVNTYRPPFNNAALDKMIKWHEIHPDCMPSVEYLHNIYQTEAIFRTIFSEFLERELSDSSLAEQLQTGGASLTILMRQWEDARAGHTGRRAPPALTAQKLDTLDALWEFKRVLP
jgi:GNAT superfamily N-acetyltransferase